MSNLEHSIADFRKAREWVSERGGDIFPTLGSLEWFIRTHRHELIRSGQLIVRRGSGGTLIGPEFDRVALQIIQRESAAAHGGDV